MESIGKLATMLFILILGMFIGGFVIMNLYNWFLPKIYGLPSISIYQAMAIKLFQIYLTPSKNKATKESEEPITDLFKALGFGVFLSSFILLIGFILSGLI